jgi:2,5-diamino-6-(ribosylamino)-4(3H)-pyrimidinone 5'-phosphate reductase
MAPYASAMKPYVICHMCTSIDGRILTSRWERLPRGVDAGRLFETTAASFRIGAWLVGTTTMHEFSARRVSLRKARERIPQSDWVARPRARSFAIGADARGALRFRQADVGGDHVVLLVSRKVSNDYLAHLRTAGVSYLFCGARHVDVRLALRKLREVLGLRKLLLEGGGRFNGALLQAGLVDEISQVIVPVVDGGVGVSGIFDIPGPAPRKAAAALRPVSHRRLPGGVHWLRYQVLNK